MHGTFKASPGFLAFGQDMILDIPVIADWEFIQKNRQQLIYQHLIDTNRKRFSHDYHIGDQVLKLNYKPDKLAPRATGPYCIKTVHTNGTVTICLDPIMIEHISIHHIKPYHQE